MAELHAETQTPRTPVLRAPPTERLGVLRWIRTNLFNSPLNTVLTLLCLWALWQIVPPFLSWAIFNSTWQGSSREACAAVSGACWTFVKVRFGQFMYGFYPADERWRINLAFAILVVGAIPLFIRGFRPKVALGAALLFIYPVIAFYLFYGGVLGLRVVETPLWGGLFLTLVLAGVGIVASLPIGVVLALGRRSERHLRLEAADEQRDRTDHQDCERQGDPPALIRRIEAVHELTEPDLDEGPAGPRHGRARLARVPLPSGVENGPVHEWRHDPPQRPEAQQGQDRIHRRVEKVGPDPAQCAQTLGRRRS
jgi:hypothetical protein